VTVGDSVFGSFRYSTVVADWDFVGVSPPRVTYQETNPDTSLWDLSVSVITNSRTISNKDTVEPAFLSSLQIQDQPTTSSFRDSLVLDFYHGNIFTRLPLVTETILNFGDMDGDLFDGVAPPTTIRFANRDQSVGQLLFSVDTDNDGDRDTTSFIEFSITTVHPVPEPNSLAVFGVLSAGIVFRRRWAQK